MKIQIQSLSKIFGSSPEKALALLAKGLDRDTIFEKTGQLIALNNVSFEVEEGEILVIMGLSGSGKSTLLRCLNNLVPPTKGKVLIDGVHVGALPQKELRLLRQRKLGMVFQNFALFPHYTVCRNVEYGLEIMGVPKTVRREKALNTLGIVGLESWADSMPHELSGGMQQRVGLARALALDPDILLMDEAFSALDPLIRRDMQEELLRVQEALQKTVVFISHDLNEALAIAGRIVLLRDGQVEQIGTPEDILTSPATEYVQRFIQGADLAKVVTAATIMQPATATAILGIDGPRTALKKMRVHGLTTLFVVDKLQRRLLGIITADDALSLLQEEQKDLRFILQKNIVTTEANAPLSDLIPLMANLPYPLAVIDEKEHLMGVIVRGSLLGALAENKIGGEE